MCNMRQIRAFVAAYEEGSFTHAAARENATQSGISQHVAALEASLGAALFARGPQGIAATPEGCLFYPRAVEALAALSAGRAEVEGARAALSGPVRAGLMPAFTRAALAPVLQRFVAAHPLVRPEVVEGYSGTLSDMVRAGQLDFAMVPAGGAAAGLRVTPLARDREMLVCAPGATGVPHTHPIRLSAGGPWRFAVPGHANIRRARLDTYFAANGVPVADLLELDSMLATLELVAQSDWVAVLPGVICAGDADGVLRHVHPLAGPDLMSDFVTIEPARAAPSAAAAALRDMLGAEINRLVRFGPPTPG